MSEHGKTIAPLSSKKNKRKKEKKIEDRIKEYIYSLFLLAGSTNNNATNENVIKKRHTTDSVSD